MPARESCATARSSVAAPVPMIARRRRVCACTNGAMRSAEAIAATHQSLACFEVPQRHVAIVFQLELIIDRSGFLAIGVGFDGKIPSQQIFGSIDTKVSRIDAKRRSCFQQR